MDDSLKGKNSECITLGWVFENLRLLGKITGSKSQIEKEAIIVKLFRASTARESKYICRFIGGNFKIGVAEKIF